MVLEGPEGPEVFSSSRREVLSRRSIRGLVRSRVVVVRASSIGAREWEAPGDGDARRADAPQSYAGFGTIVGKNATGATARPRREGEGARSR